MKSSEGIRTGALLLLVFAYAPAAVAWNETAHRVAAVIAYDALPDDQKSAVGELLRKHPRFAADFEPNLPRGFRNRSAAEQNRWYFAFAATWPDFARRFDTVPAAAEREALVARYNHGSWHYINLPTYLRPADAQRLDRKSPSMSWSPGQSGADLNVVQALALARYTLCGANASDDERALALSWLLHLIADLHQPLHTTALYAVGRFPNGDRGGNDIMVRGGTNLHALWDDALGNDRRWRRIQSMAAEYRVALDPATAVNFEEWTRQGHELAERVVYSQQIRSAVESSTLVDPDSAYRALMHKTAESQIGLAGARTALVVSRLMDSNAARRCR
jgi:hypothetical protein